MLKYALLAVLILEFTSSESLDYDTTTISALDELEPTTPTESDDNLIGVTVVNPDSDEEVSGTTLPGPVLITWSWASADVDNDLTTTRGPPMEVAWRPPETVPDVDNVLTTPRGPPIAVARRPETILDTVPFGVLQNTNGTSARKRCRCIQKKQRQVVKEIKYIPLNPEIQLSGQLLGNFTCKCSHLRKVVNNNNLWR